MKLAAAIPVLLWAPAFCQSAGAPDAQPAHKPAFEVASIKPAGNKPGGSMFPREDVRFSPGNLTMEYVTVASCLRWAYQVQDPQIAGPPWITEERFTIAAKAGEPANEGQLRLMLQTLLTDRFKVAFHRESKTMSGFALTVAKNGPKLAASASEGSPEIRGMLKWTASRYSMADLAAFLSSNMRSLVADATKLDGRFDFTLDLSPYFSIDTPIRKDEAAQILAAAFQQAIEAQLGLKLEVRKVPVDVFVVDHAENPSEN